MGSDKKPVADFPDVENKLQAPTKKSLFERQKAEAEAKRLREEAETKAVYESFVKSFDDEDSEGPGDGAGEGKYGGFSGGPPKRHFGGGMGQGGSSSFNAPSGPAPVRSFGNSAGRGGSGPGSLGPPPQSLNKKRTFDGFQQQNRREDRGLLAFEDYEAERGGEPKRIFHTSDDEDERVVTDRGEEKAVAKPTLRLTSLPPGTSPAVIKALLPLNLTVEAVRILPPAGPGSGSERKSMSAIVTMAKDTGANDIDSAVNSLQNRYLGYGYYLNLHRHLSSAAISSAPVTALGTTAPSQPFGAKPVALPSAGRGAAPPPHQRGFAPPSSYTSGSNQLRNSGPLLHVPVQAPQDVKQLKLIHKTIESLLTHGPEFEALLMSRPAVQKEERWAWLWDPRSTGGVWYRWRLWQVLTGAQTQKRGAQGKYLPLFEGSSAWKAPDQPLAWEYTTQLSEFVSDSEYNSSEEDDSGDEGPRRPTNNGGGPPDPSILADEGKAYLNPLETAKLTHLLARLPSSTGKLRKGDVARVTAFAISHAGRGADEVVSLLISNTEKPFTYTSANPTYRKTKDTTGGSGDDNMNIADENESSNPDEKEDTSSASLIGLYLISDILSSSSTSGVRHAWRYRQLFEHALKARRVFEKLGRMERKLKWGRLRAEKWKRSVGMLLSLWEGWCVFPQASQEGFVDVFTNPPAVKGIGEDGDGDDDEAEKRKLEEERKGKSKWKAVEVKPTDSPTFVTIAGTNRQRLAQQGNSNNDDGGQEEEDVDGAQMDEDEDVDGMPMDEDEDLDGVPMEDVDGGDRDGDGEPMQEDHDLSVDNPTAEVPATALPHAVEDRKAELKQGLAAPAGQGQQRRRPRAVDMFADSDDEDN